MTQVEEALAIVEAVNHPQVQSMISFTNKLRNPIAKIEKAFPRFALVHIADVPGRHKPGTGEIRNENIFRKLVEFNYKGMVAMEFRPTIDPLGKLRAAREMALRAGRRVQS